MIENAHRTHVRLALGLLRKLIGIAEHHQHLLACRNWAEIPHCAREAISTLGRLRERMTPELIVHAAPDERKEFTDSLARLSALNKVGAVGLQSWAEFPETVCKTINSRVNWALLDSAC